MSYLMKLDDVQGFLIPRRWGYLLLFIPWMSLTALPTLSNTSNTAKTSHTINRSDCIQTISYYKQFGKY